MTAVMPTASAHLDEDYDNPVAVDDAFSSYNWHEEVSAAELLSQLPKTDEEQEQPSPQPASPTHPSPQVEATAKAVSDAYKESLATPPAGSNVIGNALLRFKLKQQQEETATTTTKKETKPTVFAEVKAKIVTETVNLMIGKAGPKSTAGKTPARTPTASPAHTPARKCCSCNADDVELVTPYACFHRHCWDCIREAKILPAVCGVESCTMGRNYDFIGDHPEMKFKDPERAAKRKGEERTTQLYQETASPKKKTKPAALQPQKAPVVVPDSESEEEFEDASSQAHSPVIPSRTPVIPVAIVAPIDSVVCTSRSTVTLTCTWCKCSGNIPFFIRHVQEDHRAPHIETYLDAFEGMQLAQTLRGGSMLQRQTSLRAQMEEMTKKMATMEQELMEVDSKLVEVEKTNTEELNAFVSNSLEQNSVFRCILGMQ